MKRFIKVVITLILIVWILISILSSFDKSFFGIRVYRIGSGSMEPYLKVNDFIIIKKDDKYEVNDVITFKSDNQYITHRIVNIDGNVITTKGDNNNTNDESIDKDIIVGKLVFKFGFFGFFSYILLKPIIWILIFVIGVLIILLVPTKNIKGKHSKY